MVNQDLPFGDNFVKGKKFFEGDNLEISFTSGPAIFSCLDMGYSYSLASISALVNVSNMVICSGSFSGFLQLCLTSLEIPKVLISGMFALKVLLLHVLASKVLVPRGLILELLVPEMLVLEML